MDSEFCNVEALVTGLVDNWPHLLRPHRKKFAVLVCVLSFCAGLPMCTQVTKGHMTLNSQIRVGFEGWSVHFPTDGLLLGQWNVPTVDLLLGDSRLVLGLWGGQVPRGG